MVMASDSGVAKGETTLLGWREYDCHWQVQGNHAWEKEWEWIPMTEYFPDMICYSDVGIKWQHCETDSCTTFKNFTAFKLYLPVFCLNIFSRLLLLTLKQTLKRNILRN